MHEVFDILRSPLAMKPAYARSLADAASAGGPIDAALERVAWRGPRAFFGAGGAPDDPRRLYDVRDGVAVIGLWGPLVFNCPLCVLLTGGTPTETFARAVDAAAADGAVHAIVLDCDSPGGQTAGMDDATDAVRRAAAAKPVVAAVHSRCYSAAYWIASQCAEVVISPSGVVGSIGVFQVLEDSSERARQGGVAVHLVASRDGKGLGVPGVPVDGDDIERVRATVAALDRVMIASIAAGRKATPERIAAAAETSEYVGAAAVAAGLADRVEEHAATLARLAGGGKTRAGSGAVGSGVVGVGGGGGGGARAEHTQGALAMTLSELKEKEPETHAALMAEARAAVKAEEEEEDTEGATAGGDDEEEEDEKGGGGAKAASVRELMAAFTLPGEAGPSAEAKALAADCNAEGLSEAAALRRFAAMQAKRAATPGAPAVAAGGRSGAPGSAASRWDAAVNAEQARGKERAQAVRDAAVANPDLHAAYLREYAAARR